MQLTYEDSLAALTTELAVLDPVTYRHRIRTINVAHPDMAQQIHNSVCDMKERKYGKSCLSRAVPR